MLLKNKKNQLLLQKKKCNKSATSAFTLFELLITLSLVVVLASLSISRLSFFDAYKLTQSTEKIFSIFSYLQQKAIISQQRQVLHLNKEKNCYSYRANNKECLIFLPHEITFGHLNEVMGPPAEPIEIIKQSITFPPQNGEHIVYFNPQGTVSSGSLYLIDKNKRYMKALTCSVAEVTYIRKYHYTLKGWSLF